MTCQDVPMIGGMPSHSEISRRMRDRAGTLTLVRLFKELPAYCSRVTVTGALPGFCRANPVKVVGLTMAAVGGTSASVSKAEAKIGSVRARRGRALCPIGVARK